MVDTVASVRETTSRGNHRTEVTEEEIRVEHRGFGARITVTGKSSTGSEGEENFQRQTPISSSVTSVRCFLLRRAEGWRWKRTGFSLWRPRLEIRRPALRRYADTFLLRPLFPGDCFLKKRSAAFAKTFQPFLLVRIQSSFDFGQSSIENVASLLHRLKLN